MYVRGKWQSHGAGVTGVDGDYNWSFDAQGGSGAPGLGGFPNLSIGGMDEGLQTAYLNFSLPSGGSLVYDTLDFKPDVLLFMTNRLGNEVRSFGSGFDWLHGGTSGSAPDCELYFGAADRFGNQWAGGIWTVWFYEWYRWSYWNEGVCLGMGDPTGFVGHTQVPAAVTLDSMDPHGFTLSYDTSLDGWPNLHVLAIKSPLGAKVGTFQQPTSTGVQNITGLGFDPAGVLLFSTQNTLAQADWQSDVGIQFGHIAADGDPMGCAAVGYQGGSRYATLRHIHSPNQAAWVYNATSGDLAKATGSLITDGFSLDWSVADSQARRYGFVAFEADEPYDSAVPPCANVHYNAAHSRDLEYGGSAPLGMSPSLGFAVDPFNRHSCGGYAKGDYSYARADYLAIMVPMQAVSGSSADLAAFPLDPFVPHIIRHH